MLVFLEGLAAIFIWLMIMNILDWLYFQYHGLDNAGRCWQICSTCTCITGFALSIFGLVACWWETENLAVEHVLDENSADQAAGNTQYCIVQADSYGCSSSVYEIALCAVICGIIHGFILISEMCRHYHTRGQNRDVKGD